MTFVLTLTHLGAGAAWLGAMAYSLFVVQPRVRRLYADPERAEELYREFAAGNRWRVVALIGVIAASGGALLLVHGDGGWWWATVAAKTVLLSGAAGLFWWVSWRGWPARVFALPAELPGLQRRFRLVALTMLVLVGAAFTLGVAAAHPGH
jgi:Flp pilus assembly protein TadB